MTTDQRDSTLIEAITYGMIDEKLSPIQLLILAACARTPGLTYSEINRRGPGQISLTTVGLLKEKGILTTGDPHPGFKFSRTNSTGYYCTPEGIQVLRRIAKSAMTQLSTPAKSS